MENRRAFHSSLILAVLLYALPTAYLIQKFRGGFVGPGRSLVQEYRPGASNTGVSEVLSKAELKIFDDSTYFFVKKLGAEGQIIPVTYFMLYNDKIDGLYRHVLNGRGAVAFTRCVFLNEAKVYLPRLAIVVHQKVRLAADGEDYCLYFLRN
jgi:hypothetical protein